MGVWHKSDSHMWERKQVWMLRIQILIDAISWIQPMICGKEESMTSKQRAYLKSLASSLDPIFQVGKSSLTPQVTEAIGEAFNTRELIKVAVLKNCMDDPREIAEMVAERTHSQVVQVIGKKIVLYKPDKDNPRIQLP